MSRYLFTVLAAAIVAAPALHAQSTEARHHQHSDSSQHARMMAKLGLTPDQKTRIDAIHNKYAAQMRSAHDTSGMKDMRRMNPAHDSTMKRAMAEVRAVLDPAQQLLFDSMMTDHMKQRGARDSSDHGDSGHEHSHHPPEKTPR